MRSSIKATQVPVKLEYAGFLNLFKSKHKRISLLKRLFILNLNKNYTFLLYFRVVEY